MDILRKLLPKLDCTRGAPMGRYQTESFLKLIENNINLCVRKVPIDSDGCDIGGAYWGINNDKNLYIIFNESGENFNAGAIYRSFVWAETRSEAIHEMSINDYVKRK